MKVTYCSGVVALQIIYLEKKEEIDKQIEERKALLAEKKRQEKLNRRRKIGEKIKKDEIIKNSKNNKKGPKKENNEKIISNNQSENDNNDFADLIDNIKEDGDNDSHHKKPNNPIDNNFFDFQFQNPNEINNKDDSFGGILCDFSKIMELSDTGDKNNNNSDNVVSKGEYDSNPETKNKNLSQAQEKEEKQSSKSIKKNKFNSNDDIHMDSNDECDNKMLKDNNNNDDNDD